jgi:cytidine deaminase
MEKMLFDAASKLARDEASKSDTGEGVAAAAMASSGDVLLGVWIDAMVDSACLCAETGPICEAHRLGQQILATVCVRWRESDQATVLAACGVCQERLAYFGREVRVGVRSESPAGYDFVPLTELRPRPGGTQSGTPGSSVRSRAIGDALQYDVAS